LGKAQIAEGKSSIMPVEGIYLLYAGLVGALGASAILFASYIGLSEYKRLPKKLFSWVNLIIYILIGGLLALILQSITESWTPIQALAIGAGWPAIIQGLITSKVFVDQIVGEAKRQMQAYKEVERDLAVSST
jgi:hypothetical protein